MRLSDSPEQDAAGTAGTQRAEFAQFALENLFDISPDAILVTDASGRIRAANPRASELFGYSQDELTSKSVEDLVPERFRHHHPSHRENYHAHPRARQMGAALNLFGLRKDGSEFPVDIMLKPLQTPAGTAVLSIVRDVTEQREAQDLVRRKDLQFRSLLDGVRDYAIYLLDKDGYITTLLLAKSQVMPRSPATSPIANALKKPSCCS
jgi:formate hydrogenlyase transcriptional activator